MRQLVSPMTIQIEDCHDISDNSSPRYSPSEGLIAVSIRPPVIINIPEDASMLTGILSLLNIGNLVPTIPSLLLELLFPQDSGLLYQNAVLK